MENTGNKIVSRFFELSLKKKLVLIILFCIFAQNIFLLLFSNRLLNRQEIKTAQQHVDNECFLINKQLENMYQNTTLCANELIKEINQILSKKTSGASLQRSITYSLNYNLHLFPFLTSIIYYPEDGQPIAAGSSGTIDPSLIRDSILDSLTSPMPPENIFLPMEWRPCLGISDEPVLTFYKKVLHIDSGITLGHLLLTMKESSVSALFTNSSQHYYLIDGAYQIVSSTDKAEVLKQCPDELTTAVSPSITGNTSLTIGGMEYFLSWHPIDSLGFTLVNQIPMSELTANISYNSLLLLCVGILTCLTVFMFIALFTHMITKPLGYLNTKIQNVEHGDLKTRSTLARQDEIGRISDSFNAMVSEIDKLTECMKEEQKQKRKYELSLIQSQINPHFFYNVLDVIYVMCYQKDTENAATVTRYLANYYRNSLSNGQEVISLQDEFDIEKNYLAIQKYRYQDILNYDIVLDPMTASCKVPKMTLQPLVENALYHGLKESRHGGCIRIIGRFLCGKILLAVSDNGNGMTEEYLKELFETEEQEHHFGMQSVKKRLILYYNTSCRFRVFTKPGLGTTVLIMIPASPLTETL